MSSSLSHSYQIDLRKWRHLGNYVKLKKKKNVSLGCWNRQTQWLLCEGGTCGRRDILLDLRDWPGRERVHEIHGEQRPQGSKMWSIFGDPGVPWEGYICMSLRTPLTQSVRYPPKFLLCLQHLLACLLRCLPVMNALLIPIPHLSFQSSHKASWWIWFHLPFLTTGMLWSNSFMIPDSPTTKNTVVEYKLLGVDTKFHPCL